MLFLAHSLTHSLAHSLAHSSMQLRRWPFKPANRVRTPDGSFSQRSVAQSAERPVLARKVGGASPSGSVHTQAPVAQSEECCPVTAEVAGASPVRSVSRRGVEQLSQLAGLISRRSQVRILPPPSRFQIRPSPVRSSISRATGF